MMTYVGSLILSMLNADTMWYVKIITTMSKYRDTEPSGTKKLNLWYYSHRTDQYCSVSHSTAIIPPIPLPIGDDISIITSTT